jgi:hypothetical protein
MEVLGTAQHVITDNVFESVVPYGGCAIRSSCGATQVVIANNLFVNFGSSAVEVSGIGDSTHLPSANTTVSGNIFDMTEVSPQSRARTCVHVLGAADTIISNNQMYVRGACDPKVTAICLSEPALNVLAHDNLIRNCGIGLAAVTGQSRVGQVIDPQTFVSGTGHVPMERRRSHRYRAYSLVWTSGGKLQGPVTVDEFDPETLRYKLRQPAQLKAGDRFEVFPPSSNWNIHHNTITGCQQPVLLEAWGSPTSVLRDNLIDRGAAVGVKQALRLQGCFQLLGNHISGFDEPGSSALALQPNRLGKPCRNQVRQNVFENCRQLMVESRSGLWQSYLVDNNVLIHCGSVPQGGGTKK